MRPVPKPKQKLLQWLLFLCGLLLIGLGVWQLQQRLTATVGIAESPQADQVISSDVIAPAEVEPNVQEYTVPADQPRQIIMPTINSSGLIQKIGITPRNQLAVPTNVYFAGWYVNSVKPGENGLSIIDGHVTGEYAPGVFKKLAQLKAGDNFQIEYGDRSLRNFQVLEIKTVPVAEAAQVMLEKRPEILAQLNLITCGGRFDSQQNSYEERVIVISSQN